MKKIIFLLIILSACGGEKKEPPSVNIKPDSGRIDTTCVTKDSLPCQY